MLKADPESNGEEGHITKMFKGRKNFELISIDSTEKQNTNALIHDIRKQVLIKELGKKRGIGRAIYHTASITRTIRRTRVRRKGGALAQTDRHRRCRFHFLEQYFPTYISDTFTAEMEDELDDIANGTREYVKDLE